SALQPPADPSSRYRPKVLPLTFTELEALTRPRHAVLLALLRARVARQEAFHFELLSQFEVVLHQRPGDPEPDGPRLTGHAAARHGGEDVELIGGFGEDQRRLD